MPVGKVRFYDAEKGFGFLVKEDGGDVYVRANVLPPGVTSLKTCLLYTSDAADERSRVDLGGRRILKKKNKERIWRGRGGL